MKTAVVPVGADGSDGPTPARCFVLAAFAAVVGATEYWLRRHCSVSPPRPIG